MKFVAFWSVTTVVRPLLTASPDLIAYESIQRSFSLTIIVVNRAVASGFLTGKLINGQHAGTRLGDDNPLGKHFQKMYGSPDVMEATKRFDAETKALGLSPLEVALRWIFHHSQLTDDDFILLGASSESQIVESVGLIRKGPLSGEVLPLVGELWGSVKETRENVI
jgi:aflatoxin B1 aldehyde reductase